MGAFTLVKGSLQPLWKRPHTQGRATHTHTHTHTHTPQLSCDGCGHSILQGHGDWQGIWEGLDLERIPGISSVQSLRCVDSLRPHGLQHARPPCPLPSPGSWSNSCPLSWWCHPTISSSVIPFSSRLQSFPASGSFQMSQFFSSGGQSIGASASASVLPINIQDRFPSVLTGLICLLPKGLSRVRDGLRTLRQCWSGPSVDPCPSSLRLDDEGHYNLLLTHL